MVQVVAALIWDNGRFMACQRPAHKARGLLWEFVGGKVEAGESREEALCRECREELGVEIAVRNIYFEVDHIYPDISIHLTLFNAVITSGTPQLLEHNAIQWLHPQEIPQYEFCPADKTILEKIQEDAIKLNNLRQELMYYADPKYKVFQCSLMPTVSPDRVLGVRMPQLRKMCKALLKNSDWFLSCMPLKYYEEQNLYGLLISQCKDFSRTLSLLKDFLPHVDNWATCDLLVPVSFAKDPEAACQFGLNLLNARHEYTVRFGIGILMRFGLDSTNTKAYMDAVSSVKSDDYYVKMMIAWYFATALAMDFKGAVSYLEDSRLDKWVHNKTIQKGIESFRLTEQEKSYLRNLRK